LMGPRQRATLAIGAATALTWGAAATARAEPASSGPMSDLVAGMHCVVTATPDTAQPEVSTQCFDTLADSRAFASGASTRSGVGAADTATSTTSAGSTVVGIEYQDSGFGGGSLTLTAATDGFSCSAGRFVNFPTLPSGWDNTIGSARSYAGCKSGHYRYTNNGGSVVICGCSSLGSLDDRTSSIRFSASGT
ncbi:MAG: hypothetical protein ACRCY8_06390, partial [Dermatophilaceae bacterium]